MSYYVRYFAESPVSLKALAAGLKAIDPQSKIDGGELMRGGEVVAEVEVDQAGSDLFNEELSSKIAALEQVGAHHVIARLRGTQSIVAARVDPSVVWDVLGPLWSILPTVSTGLTQVDGYGFYDGSTLVAGLA